MAIVAVYPNLTSAGQDGTLDERAQREYRVTWMVETDDPQDGSQVVGDAPGLPKLYSTYVFGNDVDLGSRCKSITPRRVPGERLLWEVEFEYSSRLETDSEGNHNPLLRPPRTRWATSPYQRIAHHDRFGQPLMTTSGGEFDPPPMINESRLVMTYTRNESTNNIPFIFSYRDCVNSDVFQGFAPGEAHLVAIGSEREVENGTEYWSTTYEFEFVNAIPNPRGVFYGPDPSSNGYFSISKVLPFNLNLQNRDFEQLDAFGKREPILHQGKGVPMPVRIDLAGKEMPANVPRSQTVILSFEVYPAKPFAALGIV